MVVHRCVISRRVVTVKRRGMQPETRMFLPQAEVWQKPEKVLECDTR